MYILIGYQIWRVQSMVKRGAELRARAESLCRSRQRMSPIQLLEYLAVSSTLDSQRPGTDIGHKVKDRRRYVEW
jgi:hypothetical protein